MADEVVLSSDVRFASRDGQRVRGLYHSHQPGVRLPLRSTTTRPVGYHPRRRTSLPSSHQWVVLLERHVCVWTSCPESLNWKKRTTSLLRVWRLHR